MAGRYQAKRLPLLLAGVGACAAVLLALLVFAAPSLACDGAVGEGYGKFVFQGRVAAADADAGTIAVNVRSANNRARAYVGERVEFTLACSTAIKVGDRNHDGVRDLNDVKVGKKAKVKTTLPTADQGRQPFPAESIKVGGGRAKRV